MTDHEAAAVSLREIADAAGVSISSVSRALAGRGDLRRDTRARILEVARSMKYDRARTARGRPTSVDPRLIELVLGSFDSAWTDEVTAGARQSAFRHGYDLVLTLEREDPADDWPARIATRRSSGVILGLIRPTSRQLEELHGLRIPVVLFDPLSDPHGELASVGTTDWQGGYDAGAHLVATGLRRFIVLTGIPRYRFGKAREEGFRRAVEELAGDATVTRMDAPWTDADVTAAFGRFFADDRTPTGVFASDDEIALAAYRAAERIGLAIPGDLSVIGFNDEPRASAATPPLTTVRQPLGAMAARAVELVRELRERDADHFERVELPTRLIVRDSTLPFRTASRRVGADDEGRPMIGAAFDPQRATTADGGDGGN
jgi:DNA-binding LacI/PurR family transcriptional regulator